MKTPPPDFSSPVPPSIPPIPAGPTRPPVPPDPPVIPPVPGTLESGAREVAKKAIKIAEEGVTVYKSLERPTQIYLGGLAVAVLFSLLFNVVTEQLEVASGPGNPANLPGNLVEMLYRKHDMESAFGSGSAGKLAVLAAAAGIGLWVWNLKSAVKEAWMPKALAGCAGFSALMYLLLMLTSNGSGYGPIKVDVDMTLFGFWIPFAGAIAAAVVSAKKWKMGSSV